VVSPVRGQVDRMWASALGCKSSHAPASDISVLQYCVSNTLTTTVNTKGQVTIPEPLRAKYGFAPGMKVVWIERDGELIPRPVMRVHELYGYLRPGSGDQRLTDLLLDERRKSRLLEGE